MTPKMEGETPPKFLIEEVLNMKLKFIAILTIIMILVVMCVPVYAETTIPDPPYGAYDYWAVVLWYDSVYLITSPNPIKATTDGTMIITYLGDKTYNLINGYWSYDQEGTGNTTWTIQHVYASNHDIAYNDGSGFFFTPPKVSALYQAAKTADFGMILRTILAGLIPLVGLLILGISFRKGWAFLHNQLTH